jgi:hypothetical protein
VKSPNNINIKVIRLLSNKHTLVVYLKTYLGENDPEYNTIAAFVGLKKIL